MSKLPEFQQAISENANKGSALVCQPPKPLCRLMFPQSQLVGAKFNLKHDLAQQMIVIYRDDGGGNGDEHVHDSDGGIRGIMEMVMIHTSPSTLRGNSSIIEPRR